MRTPMRSSFKREKLIVQHRQRPVDARKCVGFECYRAALTLPQQRLLGVTISIAEFDGDEMQKAGRPAIAEGFNGRDHPSAVADGRQHADTRNGFRLIQFHDCSIQFSSPSGRPGSNHRRPYSQECANPACCLMSLSMTSISRLTSRPQAQKKHDLYCIGSRECVRTGVICQACCPPAHCRLPVRFPSWTVFVRLKIQSERPIGPERHPTVFDMLLNRFL